MVDLEQVEKAISGLNKKQAKKFKEVFDFFKVFGVNSTQLSVLSDLILGYNELKEDFLKLQSDYKLLSNRLNDIEKGTAELGKYLQNQQEVYTNFGFGEGDK